MVREGLLIAALVFMTTGVNGQRALDRAHATFGDGTRVALEIADTEPKRNRGLMFREALAERDGMLFVFERPGFYPFWMQNCRIALDILWLDDTFRIVSMAESVPPCRLEGCEPPCASNQCPSYAPAAGTTARYVIEVAPGFAARHGVKVGQVVPVQLPAR
jgi:uncharacterized membrane protein (UPF0127 family)